MNLRPMGHAIRELQSSSGERVLLWHHTPWALESLRALHLHHGDELMNSSHGHDCAQSQLWTLYTCITSLST
jgi:hypothetical protein